MLKIYFDWNCITHSKDKDSQILSIAEEYKERFIFPFSDAHLRDILVSHKEGNLYYESDIELLSRICGNRYLLFENEKMMPLLATPHEVIDEYGDDLEKLQTLDLISPEMYSSIKRDIKNLLPVEFAKRIEGAEPSDAISIIDKYIEHNSPTLDLESILSVCQSNVGQLKDTEARFKCICLVLDMLGFRPEKRNKQIMNIDTDASHIFYAGFCDVFVSADRKLCGKAEAMYKKYKIPTRILKPEEFLSYIEEKLQNEYSLNYIFNVIDEYGNPRIDSNGSYCKLLPTHILGLFNVCQKVDGCLGYDEKTKVGLFCYSFKYTPYLYKSEIIHFCDLIESFLPSSKRKEFKESYVTPMISENQQFSSNSKFSFICKDLDIQFDLYYDMESNSPVPMMVICFGERFEELYIRNYKFLNFMHKKTLYLHRDKENN